MSKPDYSAPVRNTGDPNRPGDPYGGVDDPRSINSSLNPANQKQPTWLQKNGGKYFAIALGIGFVMFLVWGAGSDRGWW